MYSDTITRAMINDKLINNIIDDLEGLTIDQSNLPIKTDFGHLLSDAIRQYQIPAENWHASKAAATLWSSMTSSNFDSYCYHESFTTDRLADPVTIKTYKGNSRCHLFDFSIEPNKRYDFLDCFVCEHITPAADIIKALHTIYDKYKNSSLLKEKIAEILNKIHIVRILRYEDTIVGGIRDRISEEDILTKSSAECFKHVYTKHYVPANIIIA